MEENELEELTNDIYKNIEKKPRKTRFHLGYSQLGKECIRESWLQYRWAFPEKKSGRILSLFERGKREEDFFRWRLKGMKDVKIITDERKLPEVGNMCGEIDELILYKEKKYIADYKTMKNTSFNALVKHGIEKNHAEYKAQMVLYISEFNKSVSECDRVEGAILFCICKNTDSIKLVFIGPDEERADFLRNKGIGILEANEMPEKKKKNFYCDKLCDYKNFCYGEEYPQKNCRTCKFGFSGFDGFSCNHINVNGGGCFLIANKEQVRGCDKHEFNESLVEGKIEGLDEQINSIFGGA